MELVNHMLRTSNERRFLFDQYCVHAPAVPDWFKHTSPPKVQLKNPGYCPILHHTYEHFDTVDKYFDINLLDWKPEFHTDVSIRVREAIKSDLKEWEKTQHIWLTANNQWELKDNLERLSQWAHTYANHMIEARGGSMSNETETAAVEKTTAGKQHW